MNRLEMVYPSFVIFKTNILSFKFASHVLIQLFFLDMYADLNGCLL